MRATCLLRRGLALALGALGVLAQPAWAEPVTLPGGGTVARVDFERHVMGVFGRLGCNSGSCHGSFQGRGGFRLSLFGYDPARDYLALTREGNGRRLDRTAPERSLLLLKATGQVPHGGLTRFSKRSWAYHLLRAWIVQGAKWQKGSGEVRAIRITPPESAFTVPGQAVQLRVEATFADGTCEDITPLCDFRTNDDAVAEVTNLGRVKAVRPGDTAVIVSYRGHVLPVRALVPAPAPPGFRYPSVPAANFIDRLVFAKLRRLNMVPSALCSDEEFLRRVTLDTIGSLPTPAEVRAFLADKRPDKRARKIDALLAHPLHTALWATRFCDITGNNTDSLEGVPQRRPRLSQMWHDWFRKRLAENRPYDEIVRGVLCATSREGKTPEEYLEEVYKLDEASDQGFATPYAERATLDLFWRRQQRVTIDIWGEKTAAAFLGVRLECAQCHKHPFDRWTQVDYRAYANIFAPVAVGVSPEANKVFRTANVERNRKNLERRRAMRERRKKGAVILPPLSPLREVFVLEAPPAPPRGRRPARVRPVGMALPHPETGLPLPPQALGGPQIKVEPGQDPRVALFEWLRSADNPFFARSFANRVWGHYLGVGIVQPVDDFSLANPPSNGPLLDALAADFVRHRYDIRALERAILNSRTYQLSSTPNATNRFDRNNFARGYVRPLMAEVVVDVLNDALGVTERWNALEAPEGARAIEVGSSRVQNPSVAYAFRVFGRPPRSTACDCERAMEPGLPQKLFLMADPNLIAKLRAPQNRLSALLTEKKSDEEALAELFLATLSRRPTAAEKARFAEHLAGQKAERPAERARLRREAFADVLWALINTTEFVFNH
jgi:hypothetical protein